KVTGAVKDIRPFLAHARAAVAPLRVARGVQNKVLEAMAMAKPVLATSDAMVGIQYDARFLPLVTDSPHSMIEQAVALLNSCDSSKLGSLGRELVMQRYSWAKNLSYFEQLLRQGLASTAITSGVRRRTDIRPTPNSIPRKEIS
ncbi:MAG: glycosyltransferase, partial [Gammaproteobacteria bacterium]|nr:glycosyltransferase [Gammaproteobacteria bacterium]